MKMSSPFTLDYKVIRMPIMTFPEYLVSKFLEWQHRQGKRQTIADFANYLGASQSIVSYWMNGSRKPNQTNIQLLARTFGDEVYDALGLPRPDENLSYLQRVWDDLPLEQRREVKTFVEKLKARNERSSKNKKGVE